VAIRGEFADRMRALSESHGMSLAKLLRDTLLVYERDIDAGYESGSACGNGGSGRPKVESRRHEGYLADAGTVSTFRTH